MAPGTVVADTVPAEETSRVNIRLRAPARGRAEHASASRRAGADKQGQRQILFEFFPRRPTLGLANQAPHRSFKGLGKEAREARPQVQAEAQGKSHGRRPRHAKDAKRRSPPPEGGGRASPPARASRRAVKKTAGKGRRPAVRRPGPGQGRCEKAATGKAKAAGRRRPVAGTPSRTRRRMPMASRCRPQGRRSAPRQGRPPAKRARRSLAACRRPAKCRCSPAAGRTYTESQERRCQLVCERPRPTSRRKRRLKTLIVLASAFLTSPKSTITSLTTSSMPSRSRWSDDLGGASI